MTVSLRQFWLLSLVGLALTAGASVGAAAEGSVPPHFVWIYEQHVEPAQMETFMKSRTESAQLDMKHKFEFPYLTFVDMFTVYTCGIFETFASLDGMPQKMEQYSQKTGGRSKQLWKQADACVTHCRAWISVFRPDLSYLPKEPAFTPDSSEPYFNMVDVYHVKPGKYDQAIEAAKQLKEIHEEKQPSVGYWMYERLCGEGIPALAVVTSAKDEDQLLDLQKKATEKLGEDAQRVFTENLPVISKVKTVERIYVPQASYMPEGTVGQN